MQGFKIQGDPDFYRLYLHVLSLTHLQFSYLQSAFFLACDPCLPFSLTQPESLAFHSFLLSRKIWHPEMIRHVVRSASFQERHSLRVGAAVVPSRSAGPVAWDCADRLGHRSTSRLWTCAAETRPVATRWNSGYPGSVAWHGAERKTILDKPKGFVHGFPLPCWFGVWAMGDP